MNNLLDKEQKERISNIRSQQEPVIVDNEKVFTGLWRLTYTLVNERGIEGFSGKFISTYPDAITGRDRILFDLNKQPQAGFFIDKVSMLFDPSNNRMHALILDWLIGHPEVGVEGAEGLQNVYYQNKESNPRLKLVSLDWQRTNDIDNEDIIDRVIGKILSDNPKKAITLKKARFILAELGETYYEESLISVPSKEKKHLINRIKKYAKQGTTNAKKVSRIIDDLAYAQAKFEIRELMRLGIVVFEHGSYRFNLTPIGIDIQSAMNWFSQNSDVYSSLQEKLYETLRSEGRMK